MQRGQSRVLRRLFSHSCSPPVTDLQQAQPCLSAAAPLVPACLTTAHLCPCRGSRRAVPCAACRQQHEQPRPPRRAPSAQRLCQGHPTQQGSGRAAVTVPSTTVMDEPPAGNPQGRQTLGAAGAEEFQLLGNFSTSPLLVRKYEIAALMRCIDLDEVSPEGCPWCGISAESKGEHEKPPRSTWPEQSQSASSVCCACPLRPICSFAMLLFSQ